MVKRYEWCPGFVENVHSFIRNVEDVELSEEDYAGLEDALPVLLKAYSQILVSQGGSEAEQRKGVDMLLEDVFQPHGYGVKYVYVQTNRLVTDISRIFLQV
jgi:hypothetical protein